VRQDTVGLSLALARVDDVPGDLNRALARANSRVAV
jgi:hypothetical protein